MPSQILVEPSKDGTVVKILDSGFHWAQIAECRELLGPKGARVYRVLVQKKPRPMYIEVLESQLEVLDESSGMTSTGT